MVGASPLRSRAGLKWVPTTENMAFALECEGAVRQAATTKDIAEQRRVWQIKRAPDPSEIEWHVRKLSGMGTTYDIIHLSVALCSVGTWQMMARAIPWLGRYSLHPGVSYRVFTYFASKTPLRTRYSSPTVTYSRAYNGRLHGIVIGVHEVSFRSVQRAAWTTIFYPWEYFGEKGVPFPNGKMDVCAWDRGHKLRYGRRLLQFEYSFEPLQFSPRLHLKWSGSKTGEVTRLTIQGSYAPLCPRCEVGQRIKVALKGQKSRVYFACTNCRITTRGARIRTFEQVGIEGDIPETPAEALLLVQENMRFIRDEGTVTTASPPKRYYPSASESGPQSGDN